MSVRDKMVTAGPKRLLSIDGGGIRGIVAVEVLAEMEALLRRELGRGDDFVLADYFDYIAGNSTGAIIATCLALGMPVARIREFYLDEGRDMFEPSWVFVRQLFYKFESRRFAARLQAVIGKQTTLGSDELKTLLMLVMHNMTTDSPWFVSNNPDAKYNARERTNCNLDLPLWQLVRASTAAPTYFAPERVQIGEHEFVFVDGGITPYNNPAFQLFLMATLEPYKLRWPSGERAMLLVSVGTGTYSQGREAPRRLGLPVYRQALAVPATLMHAVSNEQDLLCRSFGKCLVGDPIDSELGDLIANGSGPAVPKLFTYLRYNAWLTPAWLASRDLSHLSPENVRQIDSVKYAGALQAIGRAVAEDVQADHFEDFV